MQIGFVGALTLLFIGLKLCNVIAWDWVWVLSPIWITVLIVIGMFLLWIVGVIIAAVFSKK